MSMRKTTNGSDVILEGELTLAHAKELKTVLSRVVAGADTVTIRFGEVRDADLSFLQLLCSSHRSALRLKKRLRFEGGWPKPIRDAADAAEYSRLKGCNGYCGQDCLWVAMARESRGGGEPDP